ncbi:MAG: hypothetical protein KDE27_29295 [Planctomycetes bacterium]|nr:hypothetical protein [Planctomycetota bacterium]
MNEPATSRPDATLAEARTGLARRSLRQASHDARGHLNNLAIVHELLRTQGADGRLLTMAAESMAACVGVLEQMSTLSDTLAPELSQVRAAAIVHAACAARAGSPIEFESRIDPDDTKTIRSCATRLPSAVRSLFEACERSLPAGGSVTVALLEIGDDDPRAPGVRLTVDLRGELAHVPPSNDVVSRPRSDPAVPDWFGVATRCHGIGADLTFSRTAPDRLEVTVTWPDAGPESAD